MEYFEGLRKGLERVYSVAQEARGKGMDPEPKVEIPIAKDVAARVEGLVGPRGIASVIREMEQGGMSRPEIAFSVAERIASGDIIRGDARTLIEQAVRTAVGILTEGVLVAPTEGIADVQLNENPDGSRYIAVLFAGPIRSAGGTVAALSVALADHARRKAGIGDYRPTETEISRYVEEANVYENRCVHLQYKPPDEHIAHIVKNCPVCIDGDPTEEVEVSVHRDLERIKSNRIRGGVPLVICEGIAAKAPKVLKFTRKFGLEWGWLGEVVKVKNKADKVEIKPDFSYLEGLVAGRPVFAYPMEKGGFRLRYGRSRTNGIMGRNIHPAAMVLLDSFVANGTHVKVERPGKGAILATCDSIEPPVVRLKCGSVVRVRTFEEAERLREDVESVLFLGDILVTYGDFFKSNHPMLAGGYCAEWWEHEAAEKGIPREDFPSSAKEAFALSAKTGVPLHPEYTCHWNDVSHGELCSLCPVLAKGRLKLDSGEVVGLELPYGGGEAKAALEKLLIEHRLSEHGHFILGGNEAFALLSSLGMLSGKGIVPARALDPALSPLENACALSGITIRDKAPNYIGARMGRPEKAKERMMEGKPHVLFPTASPKDRSLTKRYKSLRARDRERTINAEIARYRCSGCGAPTFYPRCHSCGESAKPERVCQKCGEVTPEKEHCGLPTRFYDRRPVPLVEMYEKAKTGMDYAPTEVKGVKGLMSERKIPELLEKGFFRAKHDVYVFRDGTCRFDATDAPLTHFRISEIGQSVEGIKKLGYSTDHLGKPITSADQVVPLMCQDLVVSSHCMDYMFRIAAFIDDLLVNVYALAPFYNLKSTDDLLGQLVVGLSPHTSGGVLGRIIGYCDANVGYAHPYFHTAKRRNCFHPSTDILVWDEEAGAYSRSSLGELSGEAFNAPNPVLKELDAFTSRADSPRALYVHSIDPKTHKAVLKKIKYFIKSASPEGWLRIKTTTNRELLVTRDHNVLYSEKGVLKSTEAKNLSEGMEIPLCASLDCQKTGVRELNLAKELLKLGKRDKQTLMLRAPDFFKALYYKNRKKIRKLLPGSFMGKMPSGWYRSVPLGDFEVLVESGLCTFGQLPQSARIAPKRDDMSLPIRIKVDEDFAEFLGYYAAEGHSRKSGSAYQISLRICNKKISERIISIVRTIFGKEPNVAENGTKITICSRVLYLFFTKILQAGSGAHTKRVPGMVFAFDERLTKAFISAYFDGDGSVIAEPPRMHFYSVSRRLLEDVATLLSRFGIFCRYGKTKPRLPGRKVLERYAELGKEAPLFSQHYLSMYGGDLFRFARICTPKIPQKLERMKKLGKQGHAVPQRLIKYRNKLSKTFHKGDYLLDKIKSIEPFDGGAHAYCIDIDGGSLEEKNVLLNNQVFTIRCDGDEDSIILLADCLMNFSRSYLSEKRGGTMDAPLTLTPQINPSEVDDEVHCMEVEGGYPLDFYRACEKNVFPGEIKLKTVQDLLGKDEQYGDLRFTHDTATINDGPMRTSYVTLGSIPEKIEAEFALHRKLRAVHIQDAAQRLILSHFIPDLYGNLRSYSRQTFRCVNCNTIYRRVPLAGKCTRCGGKLTLTIHKGGIMKYLEISKRLVEEYSLPAYLAQRLVLLEQEISSIFEDERVKQTGLSDFM